MELRHLRYFVAVAEELSFTRAAQRLFVAQPSLSTQIAQLEKELGVQLFDRSRRAVRLTAAGGSLLGYARETLARLDRSLEEVRRVGHGEVGRAVIGFVPSSAHGVLTPLLRRFRLRSPDVALTFRELDPDSLIQGLHERRVDVGLMYLPIADQTLAHRCVSADPLVAALPADHPLGSGRAVRLDDLAESPFVLPRSYAVPGVRTVIVEALEAAHISPRVAQDDVWLMQTIVALVAAGVGVALVPSSVVEAHHRGVVFRPLQGSDATVHVGLVWRRDDDSPVVRAVAAAARELVSVGQGRASGLDDLGCQEERVGGFQHQLVGAHRSCQLYSDR